MRDMGSARAGRHAAFAVALLFWCAIAGNHTRLLAGLPEISLSSPRKLVFIDGTTDAEGASCSIGVRCEVLTRFGRLIPEDVKPEQIKRLAGLLRTGSRTDAEGVRAIVEVFPPADLLLYDGEGYEGGNYGFIDAIIGAQGRPVALDREPPMFLVPLTSAGEEALAKRREAYQARRHPRVLSEISVDPIPDGSGGGSPADLMFGDGQFVRPYCGRFDDLYFHLFQNGNAVSALAFSAVADGLSDRRYHPLTGLVDQNSGPQQRFNLNDILSSGGLSAIRAYTARSGARETTAFKGFAYGVMPYIVKRVAGSSPGDVLKVESTDVLRAMRGEQRLYPTRVPPLYVSPDRFLGWTGSWCVPVVSLPQETMNSYCPLPKGGPGNGDQSKAADNSASDRLFESSSTNQLIWEDPQDSDLLSDARDAKGRKRSSGKPGDTGAGASKAKKFKGGFLTLPRSSDLTRGDGNTIGGAPGPAPSHQDQSPSKADNRGHSSPPPRLIAVVAPTAAETAAYASAIQANDDRLRAAEEALGRTQKLRSELTLALPALPMPSTDGLQQTVADDLASLDRCEGEIRSELLSALNDRAAVRALLERRLLDERVAPLRALGR